MAVGQFFSQRFGYGVHALAYMGKKPYGELTTLPELADWLKSVWRSTSSTYLSNVMQRLARAGITRSHRGIAGGYSLARPAEKITLRDLVEVLEGIDIERCSLSLEGQCPVAGRCSIQRRLQQLELQYLKALAQVTVAQLTKEVVVPRRATKA
jgi:Rrf2 family protein